MPEPRRRLDLVPDEPDPDADAAAALREALISAREQARREIARVTFPRIQAPLCDEDGKYVRDAAGKFVVGPLALYFHRLNPETMSALRKDHTRRVPVRRAGQTSYDEQLDPETFGEAWIYASLLGWCRERYFEDQRLWGDEPVGTGAEYFKRYLTDSERGTCVDALARLQHGDGAEAELLGKDSASPAPRSN